MIFLFIFVDVVSFLFGMSAAVLTGERFGDEFAPNIVALAISFFLVRSFLYWIVFNSIIKRDLPWIRNIVQSIFLIISLPFAAFFLTAVPNYLITYQPEISEIILFFTDVQGATFYFIVLPAVALVISFILHKFYKLESW